MKPPLKCPHCDAPLQSFLATPPEGADLELERCTRCGGVWCPDGRLQASFGQSARPQLVGGTTHRRCAFCRILLTPALLPGGLSVEMCSACRGLFLDAGELQQLGGRERQAPRASGIPQSPVSRPLPPRVKTPSEPARPAAVTTFVKSLAPTPAPAGAPDAPVASDAPNTFTCVRCGQRKPLREGQAYREGLACRSCMRAVLG